MDLNTRLMNSIHNKDLFKVSSSILASEGIKLNTKDILLLQKAIDTCLNIRNNCIREGKEICRRLKTSGIEASLRDLKNNYCPPYHQVRILIRNDNPAEAVNIATQMGYVSKLSTSTAEWQVFRRRHNQITLIKTDQVTIRLVLKWYSKRKLSPLGRYIWPNEKDARYIPFTSKLWPLAFIIRPFRVLFNTIGLMRPNSSLGWFLVTPTQLIPELLRFASLRKHDILYDIGSGDGRVVIEAAKLVGCKAIGYEQDSNLCDIARQTAERKGVHSLVQIINADANLAPIEKSTVVFVFLPPATVSKILPSLLDRLPKGSKIVAHEQNRIDCEPAPTRSIPLITHSAFTVAHQWTV